MAALRKVALIGAGGTISSLATHRRDYMDYPETGRKLSADEVIAEIPELAQVAELVAVPFRSVGSSAIGPDDWLRLHGAIRAARQAHPDLAGVVILHGTATLEETAWFLHLTLPHDLPVVVVGAQRPPNTLSSDAPANAVNALRVAADPASVGRGVLVVLNDEIHSARFVTKGSTFRLDAFHSGAHGPLGVADPDRIVFDLAADCAGGPAAFDLAALDRGAGGPLARVDICYAYAGSDGTALRAFVAAGARGIISAGFAPGMPAPAEREAMVEAAAQGVVIVQSSRAGTGRVARRQWLRDQGWIAAGDLGPQKARILLMLALSAGFDAPQIQACFDRL